MACSVGMVTVSITPRYPTTASPCGAQSRGLRGATLASRRRQIKGHPGLGYVGTSTEGCDSARHCGAFRGSLSRSLGWKQPGEPGMHDMASLFAQREAERYALHTRHLNEQLVRVLKAIGYDVGFVSGRGQYLF